MAQITLSPSASGDANSNMYADQIPDYRAFEDIEAYQPVFIDFSVTGAKKVKKAVNGSPVHGVAARKVRAGQPITIFGLGARFHASDTTLTSTVYYAGTGGTIHDAATALDATGMFIRCNDNDLKVINVGKLA